MRIIVLILVVLLTSCSTTKVTYQIGNKYSAGPNKSTVTGWTYIK